jgi:hypothetical protein
VTRRHLTRKICGAVFILVAVCAYCALYATSDVEIGDQAEDPVGAWKLTCVSPDGKPRECVVTVFREGAELKGNYTTDGVTRPVKTVVFDEGVLSVEVDGKFAGQAYGLTYKGTQRGDELHGSVRWSYGWASGSFAFDGVRIEQQVASAR